MKKLILILSLLSSLSFAAPQCGSTDKIVKILRSDYSETPILKATDEEGKFVTIWYSKEENTYTVLESSRDGNSCIISVGKNLKPYLAEQSVSR